MQPSLQSIGFLARGSFHADLKRRVDLHFLATGRSRHGGLAMAAKSFAMIAWLASSWLLLMFLPVPPWVAVLLTLSTALAMGGVGFCVMHDANHCGTSSSARTNGMMSFTLDLLGASSCLWRLKHNVMHHSYPNVAGVDPDIEAPSPLLRVAPWQPHRRHHRFQHLYVWVLYGLFPLRWWFVDDFRELVTGRIGGRQFRPPRGRTLVIALAGKVIFVCWTFVMPALLHPLWVVALLGIIGVFVLGNLLAIVFQLAHCVGQAEFIDSGITTQTDWASHQVATTVDFARGSRVLGWYLGGLNFQIEHHLFPRICHVHYGALSAVVEETCRAHGVRYRSEPTLWSALRANWRWLRSMGACPEPQHG